MNRLIKKFVSLLLLIAVFYADSAISATDFDPQQQYDATAQGEKIFAVHATKNIPVGGILLAGIEELQAFPPIIQKLYPIFRPTVHFSLGEMVRPVTDVISWEECPIAVVVPLKELLPRLVNLNCYDTFIIGNFQLSNSTILVMPVGSFTEELPASVQLHFYDPSKQKLREVVDEAIALQGGWHILMNETDEEDELCPAFIEETEVNNSDFFAPLLEAYPSICVGLRFDPCDGEVYRLGEIELLLREITKFYLLEPRYIPTEALLDRCTQIEEHSAVLFEYIDTMNLPNDARELWEERKQVVLNWINIVNEDIRLRNTYQRTLIGSDQYVLELIYRNQSSSTKLAKVFDAYWKRLPKLQEEELSISKELAYAM